MIFNKYGKTKQFRDVVKDVQQHCKHKNIPLPTVELYGTVKLHGTNAGIGYRLTTDLLWAQSRERIITPEDDNAGFAKYVETNKEFFKDLMADMCIRFNVTEAMIYGEWAGGSIQSGVAIAKLEKQFYIFAMKVYAGSYVDGNGETVKVWQDAITYCEPEKPFKYIWDFEHFHETLNLNNPSAIQNRLVELTMQVEEKCPVAAAQGVEGIGEGIVWQFSFDGVPYMFKTKGEKHSVSKVKTLAEITPEELARIAAAADAVDTFATTARLDQGFDKLRELGLTVEMKNLGAYLKWVCNDILEEDGGIIDAAMLDRKLLMKKVTDKAKRHFMEKMNEVSR